MLKNNADNFTINKFTLSIYYIKKKKYKFFQTKEYLKLYYEYNKKFKYT